MSIYIYILIFLFQLRWKPDRDSARWKLSPAEVQKRRALFWELFITDCWQVCRPMATTGGLLTRFFWQSLATGRLATYSLPFVDCELPFDPDQTIAEDGSTQPSCKHLHNYTSFQNVLFCVLVPFWKARFGAECVSAVVQGTLTSRAPKYSIILDLDRKVRDMEIPLYALGEPPHGKGLRQTMSHFMPQNYRELSEFSLKLWKTYVFKNSFFFFSKSATIHPSLFFRSCDFEQSSRPSKESICAVFPCWLSKFLYHLECC